METKIAELEQLLWQQRDGLINAAGLARIDALVVGDAEVRRFYIRYSTLCGGLRWLNLGAKEERRTRNEELAEGNDELQESAGGEPFIQHSIFSIPHQIPDISVPHSSFLVPISFSFSSYVGGALFSYLIAAMILGMGLLAAWAWKLPDPAQIAVQSGPGSSPVASGVPSRMQFVGRISGMFDCQWADPTTAAWNHAHVPLGRKYALASGLMEITYDTGAKVILQGPVTYEVESAASGYLSFGKLTARVEKKAESGERKAEDTGPSSAFGSPLSAFAVRTPTAVVTDLGTEFGVEVSKEGRTTSHVFRGVVVVQAMATKGALADEKRVLHENETVMVEEGDVKRIVVPAASDELPRFVRAIPKPIIKKLDLVDVVAGGDGFSDKRNRGIDPTNGQPCDTPPPSSTFMLVGDKQYHRVEGMPFVDGVFVSDGRDGPMQIDSAGHTFSGFPGAPRIVPRDYFEAAHLTSGYVWAGGAIAIPPCIEGLRYLPVVLGGVDYTSAEHGVLCLHANKGITFDLEAIRRANPGWRLVQFRSVAANVDAAVANTDTTGLADIWVLVDGQSRFQRREVNRSNSAFSVVIPIAASDRFLTLAATDGGDSINWDWIVFGDPRLEFVSINGEDTRKVSAE